MSFYQIIDFKSLGDQRGDLIAIEGKNQVPFQIKRVYYIFNSGTDVVRGFHAHKELEQVAVCVSGSCTIKMDNGIEINNVVLDSPRKGITIDPMIWHEMYDFSEDCVLLVLASDVYDEQDYIRCYNEFSRVIGNDS